MSQHHALSVLDGLLLLSTQTAHQVCPHNNTLTLTYYSSYLVIISTGGNKNSAFGVGSIQVDSIVQSCDLPILYSHTPYGDELKWYE